jgi:ribonuclease T1
MSRKSTSSQLPRRGPLPGWAVVVFFLAVIGVAWWQTQSQLPVASPARDAARTTQDSADEDVSDVQRPIDAEVASESHGLPKIMPSAEPSAASVPQDGSGPRIIPQRTDAATTSTRARFENQVIRDRDGQVVFRGAVELQSTLDRIGRGERNSHRNDGTTFQNRERRLPIKPSGYYKEYVHPTRGVNGPGPQRVILGRDGDAWYTPDHYLSFQRIR